MLLCGLALACSCDDGITAPVDPNDLDGDGIPNALDNCPGVRAPSQHDEDGDGFGDACDVCPTVVDPLQTDRGETDSIAFEDGVGDACDPRPTRGGDKIGALHTFAEDTAPSWRGAGWAIAADRVRASEAARWQHAIAVTGDAVTARLAIESLAWTGTDGSVAVALDGDGVEGGRSCTLFQDRDSDGSDELEVQELGGAIETLPLAGVAAGPVELVVQRGVERRTGTGTIHCRLLEGGVERRVTVDTTDDATTGPYVSAAAEADVVATSLVVYRTPIACPSVTRACNQP